MKPTYTVKQLDRNSQTVDVDGRYHAIHKWDCGHKHRTVEAAQRCLDTLDWFTRSIDAGIYASDGSNTW